MAKNILVFSDGTGQVGGQRPDQRLSNVYKLFRATRVGPDNAIDPSKQIAFYDAGLGTDALGSTGFRRLAMNLVIMAGRSPLRKILCSRSQQGKKHMNAWLRVAASVAAFVIAQPAVAVPQVTPSERVKRTVVVRADPTTSSTALDGLEPGEDVLLDGEVSGWYRIRLPDGRIGYVSKAWTVVVDAGTPMAAVAGGPLKVHVIDVGTGLAVFIDGPGFTMLYDGGSQDDLATKSDNRILAYIQSVHPGLQTLDHLVLSHPHKDHLELLPDVFDAFAVRNVWDSGAVNTTRGYCRFLRKVESEVGVQYHDAIASGAVHEVTFKGKGCSGVVRINEAAQMTAAPVTLGPGTAMTMLYRDAAHHADPNENSVVVRLDFGSRRILFAGDAEGGGRELPGSLPGPNSIEGKLIACCAADLRSDVLIVGHHGSLTSSRRAFLDKVGASIYVISSGPHPYSKVVLPDPSIETELRSRGELLQTDLDDDRCASDEAKIGPDNDESPGGCDNVVVSISPSGIVAAEYNRTAD